MAAGKSSAGRALAGATGRRFVDLDEVLASGGGPARLAAGDEAGFRQLEAAALAEVLAAPGDAIVATGGGAAAHGDNLERMRAVGLVVALGVDVAEAERRAAGDGGIAARPLLARAGMLAAQRAPVYRRAHAVVDTTGRALPDVVAQVRAVERVWSALPASERGATVLALGDRSYPITVGDGLPVAVLHAQLAGATRIAVITDSTVAQHHLATLEAALAAPDMPTRLAPREVIAIAPGEGSKSIAEYARVASELVARGLDRGSMIVALGGGVVGDLAGFVAATYGRGIPVIQIPTTLVAMTDAAIGGKTAIDLPAGKNLLGAFWQPRLVACATATLGTLPGRERRAGFGELWKYALLDGPDLWAAVAACAPWAAGPDGTHPPDALRAVIDRAIAYKAAIVSRDEREQTGHRALLNLGHTVGHAIESASGMLHGEAVGLGLVAAARVSAAIAGGPADLADRISEALRATGMPHDPDPWLTEPVLARLAVDKKRHGTHMRFIAIHTVGACEPIEILVTELHRILRRDSAAQ